MPFAPGRKTDNFPTFDVDRVGYRYPRDVVADPLTTVGGTAQDGHCRKITGSRPTEVLSQHVTLNPATD